MQKKKQDNKIIIVVLVILFISLVLISLEQRREIEEVDRDLEHHRSLNLELREDLNTQTETLNLLIREMRNLARITSKNIETLDERISSVDEKRKMDLEQLQSNIDSLDKDFSDFVEDLYPSVLSINSNKGTGSGFFIREDGYIVTNAHVVKGATKIAAVTNTGKLYDAFLVGSSDTYDIAVLKILGKGHPALEFEDMKNVKPGQNVVTIGNPLGLTYSVTQGVVSGLNRQFKGSLINFIQTDTPINPGNSGGPVINSNKKVIGIATGIIKGSNSVGFAISADQAQWVINNII